jgi:hypothetical protein
MDEKADIAYRKIGDPADFQITQIALELQSQDLLLVAGRVSSTFRTSVAAPPSQGLQIRPRQECICASCWSHFLPFEASNARLRQTYKAVRR